ncbi:hypothetical protein [Bradyrhizobium guangdongense]|uniref:hypothetical protein n=1 Tax=Bradyrhizobium guangdongense TaxID=1325090 RepID=UPI00112CFAAF|nr:hypothetical protein [Bradyrhizobium guangdongense]
MSSLAQPTRSTFSHILARAFDMSINPSFDAHPIEGAIVGKLVVSFGEIELLFGLVAAAALGNQNMALRAMYRSRSTGGRIDLADVLMRDTFVKVNLKPIYEETLGAVRHCLKIRNQYAHCHWAHGSDGLYFSQLEDAANRAQGFDYDHKHIGLSLLKEQQAFFDNMKLMLLYLGDNLNAALGRTNLSCPKPPVLPLPNLHNPASQHVPHWLSEDAKHQHLERALEAEGTHPQRVRPPSVLRLTEEEWIAKYRKEGRPLPD